MRVSVILALAPLAISVGALQVTEPKKDAEIDASGSFVVKWSSVDSDPSTFDLYLVNNAVYPNVNKKIASGIDTSDGSYTAKGIDAAAGDGYQVNLLSDSTENTGILAQSQQFNVTGSSDSSSTTTGASSLTSATTATSSEETTTNALITTTSAGTVITSKPTAASGSASGSVSGTSSAAPTTSLNAGGSIAAHPAAAAGIFAGVLVFAL
ncbi:hypothetical protein N7532_008528 [Penicillium argentinense]|uniref:Yeast cell wall synthesis Kre9/Knh1-like N-terminal domain-containing protein n=1 Tax=Penicillium argentinense TaxID=1131581 RepID=A0A9W9EXS7_9EURO|nr:uncharacterized protein N7532_008528 [Penicillium argentinense]KAJ5089844.1 hypothetical protein N7532_008528 [Penicillium argentinense]